MFVKETKIFKFENDYFLVYSILSKQILKMFFPLLYSFFLAGGFRFNPEVHLLLFTSFTVYYTIYDCLSSKEFLILLIWL